MGDMSDMNVDQNEVELLSQQAPERDVNAVLKQLDLSGLLRKIELTLKGMEWDEESEKFQKTGLPLLNDMGVHRLKTILRGILDTNTILSNLEDDSICDICVEMGETIIWLIAEKHTEYGVDISDRDLIVDIITRIVYTTLKRAQAGLERKTIREIVQVHELKRIDENPRKGRFGIG
jgi:phosphopantothenate synthetase